MPRLSLRFLGAFQATIDTIPIDGFKSDKARALLAYLAVEGDRPHSRQSLAGLLWPEWSEQSAQTSLRSALANLRKLLGDDLNHPPFLLISGDTIQLNLRTDCWLDVAAFRQLLAGSPQSDSPGVLEQAAALYRGPFLEGFSLKDSPAFDEWCLLKREHLNQQALSVFFHLAAFYEERGEYERAIPFAWRQVELAPWQEEAHQQLMKLLALNGQRSAALAQFQVCQKAMHQELGVEPAPETLRLYARIRQGALPSPPATRTGAPTTDQPPYKGLHFFDLADAGCFFGREQLTASLVTRIKGMTSSAGRGNETPARFLAVIGASGSGKSSVVRAGLVPALMRGLPLANEGLPPDGSKSWKYLILTPTAHPLEALVDRLLPAERSVNRTDLLDFIVSDHRGLALFVRQALFPSPASTSAWSPGNDSRHLLLVVDQFEDLFTLCQVENERAAFIDNILWAAGALAPESGDGKMSQSGEVIVVAVLRADFYAQCAPYPALRQALSQNQEYIGPMSTEELRRAIEQPARLGSWELQPGLVDLILRDIDAQGFRQPEPGALPLLSHAMLETWERRRGRQLTLSGYGEAGGVRGAITNTAELTYSRLSSAEQDIAHDIFLRLTVPGEAGFDTRRPAALDEFLPSASGSQQIQSTLQTLVEARLLTASAESVEVAHEALIREWPRLQAWLEEDRQELRLQRQIGAAAQTWEQLGRDPGALYRGTQLALAREWALSHPGRLLSAEQAFLDESIAWASREQSEREAQSQREIEAARNLAEAERERAEIQARAARQLRRRAIFLASALLLVVVLAGAALFLGQQARREARLSRSNELAALALNKLEQDPELSLLLAIQAADSAPTRQVENALHQALQTSRILLTYSGHRQEIFAVAYSPDGKLLATASQDGTAQIWQADTGKLLLSLDSNSGEVLNLVFSPDGSRLATASLDGTARVWDLTTGKTVFTLAPLSGYILPLVFSPEGDFLISPGESGQVIVWDARDGRRLFAFNAHAAEIAALAISPDGATLATAGSDAQIKIWDLAGTISLAQQNRWPAGDPKPIMSLDKQQNEFSALAFSPDGTRLASANFDMTAKIWNVSSGELLQTLTGHTSGLRAVAFSPDGTRVLTAGQDGLAKVWDADSGLPLFSLAGHAGAVNDVAVSPDGSRAATAGRDGLARVWDIMPHSSRELLTLPGFSGVFSLDGTRLITVGYGGENDLREQTWPLDPVAEPQPLASTSLSLPAPAVAGAFSPDRTRTAAVSADGSAHLWDTATGTEISAFLLTGQSPEINAIDLSPDGAWLATASSDGTARVWDTATGEALLTLSGPSGAVTGVSLSPDGNNLLTAHEDATAHLWQLPGGQEVLVLRGHTGVVTAVAFSPDGTRLATGSMDGTARLWDAKSGESLHTLTGHTATLLDLAFSPDGKQMASTSYDGTTRIWDVANGEEIQSLSGHAGMVNSVAFSPDGMHLVTGSFQDMTVRVHLLDLEELVALARSRLTRGFTLQECRQYLQLEQCPSQLKP